MDIKTLESFKLSDAIKFHDTLNPKLWRNQHLRPEVKDQLILIAQDFLQELGISDLDVKDMTISGSNAAYSYSDHSDLDLHILVDMGEMPNDEVYNELFNAKKTLYNDNHDIKIHGVPVELYVQDSREPVVSLGEYSILNDKWLRLPTKRRANFDQTATKSKYEKLLNLIQLALKSKDLKKVSNILKTIKQYRQAGLDLGGEFGPENLAYKALRSQGYITKMYDLRDKLHSEKLTIETMYQNPLEIEEAENNNEIKNYQKLDNILKKLCVMVVKGQKSEKDYGMVAACVLDPDNNIVAGLNMPGEGGKRVHAERVAIEKYEDKYGPVPDGSIVITTLSPCNESDDETAADRVGESCTDYLNDKGIKKVYCGYIDPTQDNFNRQFNLMETGDRDIREECKSFADTFLDEDYDPNGPPPGPEFKPTMPAGTVKVDVSDVYDWYKLGQHISNLKGLGHHDFGSGPPSTIMAFGSEPEEHKYIKDLEKTGLTTTDIDPVDPKQPKGMKRQKTDPTYNVSEDTKTTEHYDGIEISLEKENDEIMVTAMANGKELGQVLFVEENGYLLPQDLEVDERYRGQGVAATMYNYVKSQGYKIRRSGQQTDAGAGFWGKHRPEQNVWEARRNPEQNPKSESGMKELASIAKTISDPENWAISMTSEPKLGINPQVGISEDTPKGIYFYPLNYALGKTRYGKLPWGNDYPYIQLFQYDRSREMTKQTKVDPAKLKQALLQYCPEEVIQQAIDDPEYDGTPYWFIYDCLSRLGQSDETNIVRWNKVLRDLGFTSVYDDGDGWIAYSEPTQGVVLDPRVIKQHKTIVNKKQSGVVTPAVIEQAIFEAMDMALAANRVWQMYDPDGSKLRQAAKEYAKDPKFKPYYGKPGTEEIFDKAAGYGRYGASQLSNISYEWYQEQKAQSKVNEASGYIPSEKEKNDPRFKTALTVDVKPDSIKKNAKSFYWKTSRAGIPPQARTNGKY